MFRICVPRARVFILYFFIFVKRMSDLCYIRPYGFYIIVWLGERDEIMLDARENK